jgi:RNA 2',3'-cyclic 3'-phosphodiesterase
MPRLFVAVELPAAAAAELARIRPPPADGVRLVEPHQMHVTLHFLGEGDVECVSAALASVPAAVLPLTIDGVGQFSTEAGGVILWAGVRRNPALMALHVAVAAALAGEGSRREEREYVPHVTLARCEPGMARGLADEFLARHAGFSLPNVPTDGFRLCSIDSTGGTPVYHVERSFEPRAGAGGTT